MGLGDFLLGKKFGPSQDALATADDVSKLQRFSAGTQQDVLAKLAERGARAPTFINKQVAREERLARGSFEDQLRSIRQKVAQRGMGRSSVGFQAELGAERNLGDRIRDIRSSLGGRIEAEKERRLMQRMGAAGSAFGQSMSAMPLANRLQSGRAGGMLQPLLTVAGGAAGSMMGGPAGGQAGAQIGSGVGGGIQGGAEQRAATGGGNFL